jgi:predicted dehydrogenase
MSFPSIPPVPRRRFFRSLAASSAALAFPAVIPASALGRAGRPAPSERVTLAMIGCGNQGINDLFSFLGDERVQIVAVCDPNAESPGYWDGKVAGREVARNHVESKYAEAKRSGNYKGCDSVVDFRDILSRPDIDAVEICTPDHWHAIPVILACKARKDIYCQKPLSLTIEEGRLMSAAVVKYGVVFQTGSQQRSDPRFRRAAELVRNGRIGKLEKTLVGMPSGRPDYGKTGDRKNPEPVPPGFDYDLWLGPAPEAPYAPARCHVNFRWILDYSGGQLTDWGGHHPDCAQWGMGTELSGPVELRNISGSFEPRDPIWNTATEYAFDAVYDNGLIMSISSQGLRGGVTFIGSEGEIWVNRGNIKTKPESLVDSEIKPEEIHLYKSDDHFRNFIDCVFSRNPTAAPVEVAHRSITICHLGNIALRLGRSSLKWDPRAERILDDAEASKMLSRPYRDPWKLPEI